jgi:hypothetical protein
MHPNKAGNACNNSERSGLDGEVILCGLEKDLAYSLADIFLRQDILPFYTAVESCLFLLYDHPPGQFGFRISISVFMVWPEPPVFVCSSSAEPLTRLREGWDVTAATKGFGILPFFCKISHFQS